RDWSSDVCSSDLRNRRARRRWRAACDKAHGSCPKTEKPPCAGRWAQARVASRVVLPAPEGPIRASCSPGAMARSSSWRAAGACAATARCRTVSFSSRKVIAWLLLRLLQQAGVARRRFDRAVVGRPGRDELAGALQVEDL